MTKPPSHPPPLTDKDKPRSWTEGVEAVKLVTVPFRKQTTLLAIRRSG